MEEVVSLHNTASLWGVTSHGVGISVMKNAPKHGGNIFLVHTGLGYSEKNLKTW